MKKTLVSFAILFCVCLLFFWPIFKGFIPFPGDLLANSSPYASQSVLGYIPGSYPNKAQGKDVITEMYPWRYFTISELKQGRIPFWNPHNFAGNVLMQNLQSSVFNPFNVFFFIFPFSLGWTFFILIQPLLASWFFYLFVRELKVSRFAAVVGGVGFAFSSYMTVWIEYGNIAATLAYLPLLLFFVHRFLKNQKIQDYCGFIIAAFLMLLSGYIQGAFYSYLVVGLFVVYLFFTQSVKPTKKNVLALLFMFGLPLFLSTFQLAPTYEVFLASTRWPYSLQQFQNMLQPVWYWITLFASDFFGNPAARNYYLQTTYIERVGYIGIPLLVFAVYAMYKKRQFSLFFAPLAFGVLILVTNFPGIAYLYRLPIPVINTTVPTRFLSIFMFAGVVLATFGIDELFRKRENSKKILVGFLSVYACLWAGILVAKKVYPQFAMQIAVSERNLIVPTALFFITCVIFFLAKKFGTVSKILLFTLVVADLLYVFAKITPFAPVQTLYPQNSVATFMQKNAGINRYWGYGSAYVYPNFQTVDGTYSPEGNDPLHIKTYGDLLATSQNGVLPVLPPRPDANLVGGYGPTGMENPYRQKLLNLLGVKYIVQNDAVIHDGNQDLEIFPPSNYRLVWSQSPWQIYENKHVLARYFLVGNYKIAKGQKALDTLYTSDLSKTVILEHAPAGAVDSEATGKAVLTSYGTQRITFVTKTTGPMILFLSDTYFSSWKAVIDGKQTPVFLADYAFRGLVVPKGTHTIVMYYYPQYFFIGLKIALVAFVVFLLSIIFIKRHEK